MKSYLNQLIFLLLIMFAIPFKVNAIVEPTDRFYINDYANILSQETEDYIFENSVKLNEVDGTQIVVVTVSNLEGETLEGYANKLFNEWGIGDADKNNGLLLLLALQEREFRVEVGYGLEGILPDSKTGRFQDDYIIPYLKNNKWDAGIKNGYDAFYKEIVELNNLDLNSPKPKKVSTSGRIIFLLFVVGFVCGLVLGSIVMVKTNFIKILIVILVGFISYDLVFIQVVHIYIQSFLLGVFLALLLIYRIYFKSSGSGGGSSSSSHSGGGGRSGGGGSSRRF